MNIVRLVKVDGWLSYESLFIQALKVSAIYTRKKRMILITTVFQGYANHWP